MQAAVRFGLDLFLTAAITGALIGWGLGGNGSAALRMALAAVAFSVGPGHNIPFFAGTSGAARLKCNICNHAARRFYEREGAEYRSYSFGWTL